MQRQYISEIRPRSRDFYELLASNNRDEDACLKWAGNKENVEVFWCGEPPKGEACTPTPAPAKTYSYNFDTMQPTLSPTPQATPP